MSTTFGRLGPLGRELKQARRDYYQAISDHGFNSAEADVAEKYVLDLERRQFASRRA